MKKVKLNELKLFQKVKVSRGVTMQMVPNGWVHSEIGLGIWVNTFIPMSKAIGNEEYEVIN